jgi:hypothetical protein
MPADQIAYPEWTDYRDQSGLDPLGMQISSINLYQRLLPGISDVTLRMRYTGSTLGLPPFMRAAREAPTFGSGSG